MKYEAPDPYKRSFTCPYCGVLARHHRWGHVLAEPQNYYYGEEQLNNQHAGAKFGRCENCTKVTVWIFDRQVMPSSGNAPLPNSDMPADVRADYEEAALIFSQSPRGAAALLRLAVQKLMIHLGQPGKKIDDDIKALVRGGLNVVIQQALDIVRVTGNNAVHPGVLNADDMDVAQQLFPLINVIVEAMISVPARVDELYSKLPEGARAAIARRDGQQSDPL